MKNENEFEKLLLLKSSGELDAGQTRRLEELLESEPGLLKISAQNDAIMKMVRVDAEQTDLKPEVRDPILRAAERAASDRRLRARVAAIPARWRPALLSAAAALLALAAGSFLLLDKRPGTGGSAMLDTLFVQTRELDAELKQLDQMLTSALLELAENYDTDRDAEALASELLRMEDMKI
jgi:hypothetical protein